MSHLSTDGNPGAISTPARSLVTPGNKHSHVRQSPMCTLEREEKGTRLKHPLTYFNVGVGSSNFSMSP